MKPWLILSGFLVLAFGWAGWQVYQNGLVLVPLASSSALYVPPSPSYGQDGAVLEAFLPAGPGLDAFLRNQSDLTLLARTPDGRLASQLVSSLQRSRNGRRWVLVLRSGWRLQRGGILDAAGAVAALAGECQGAGAKLRILGSEALELRFRSRAEDVPDWLAAWRIPGSGPFIRRGTELSRFDGFTLGRAGVAGLHVATDPSLRESRTWADALVHRRWDWAAYPGQIAPDDMARVRESAYDQVRLKDGSVWFVSRRLRRFHPERSAWPETRLFGVWRGEMDLPREADAP
jgi:hypothetical protein